MGENNKPEAVELQIEGMPHNIEPYGQFTGKLDKYGEGKRISIDSKAIAASNMAEKLGYDGDVVNAITRLIGMSSPAYEEIGEEFLKEKMRI